MTDDNATGDGATATEDKKAVRAARAAKREAAGRPPREKKTEAEVDLHRRVAKAMWKVQKAEGLPEGSEARKEAWKTDKNEMVKQARKIVQRMEKAGITLTVNPEAAAEADKD